MSIFRLFAHAVKLGPSSFFPILGIVRFSRESRRGGHPLLVLLGLPSPPLIPLPPSLGSGAGGPLSPLWLVGGEGSSPSVFGLGGGVTGGSAGFLPSRLDPAAVPLISGVFNR